MVTNVALVVHFSQCLLAILDMRSLIGLCIEIGAVTCIYLVNNVVMDTVNPSKSCCAFQFRIIKKSFITNKYICMV